MTALQLQGRMTTLPTWRMDQRRPPPSAARGIPDVSSGRTVVPSIRALGAAWADTRSRAPMAVVDSLASAGPERFAQFDEGGEGRRTSHKDATPISPPDPHRRDCP